MRSANSLPFANDTFDIVYSANVLEHTERPLDVLFESLRVLRPGEPCSSCFPTIVRFTTATMGYSIPRSCGRVSFHGMCVGFTDEIRRLHARCAPS